MRPGFNRRKQNRAGWFDMFQDWLGTGRTQNRRPKPPRKPFPPSSGMPADPPDKPGNPPLAGGAEARLDFDEHGAH